MAHSAFQLLHWQYFQVRQKTARYEQLRIFYIILKVRFVPEIETKFVHLPLKSDLIFIQFI